MPTLPQLNMSQVDPETGLKQLDVVHDAIRSLADIGLTLPGKPSTGYDGILPVLTDLDDNELGELLQKASDWTGFVNTELAKVESELEVAKAQFEFVQATVRIAMKAVEGRLTVQDKTDAMKNDKRVSEAHSKYLFHFTKYNILRALRDKAQSSWDTVSRRISQRLAEIDRAKRGENVTTSNPLRSTFRRG